MVDEPVSSEAGLGSRKEVLSYSHRDSAGVTGVEDQPGHFVPKRGLKPQGVESGSNFYDPPTRLMMGHGYMYESCGMNQDPNHCLVGDGVLEVTVEPSPRPPS